MSSGKEGDLKEFQAIFVEIAPMLKQNPGILVKEEREYLREQYIEVIRKNNIKLYFLRVYLTSLLIS